MSRVEGEFHAERHKAAVNTISIWKRGGGREETNKTKSWMFKTVMRIKMFEESREKMLQSLHKSFLCVAWNVNEIYICFVSSCCQNIQSHTPRPLPWLHIRVKTFNVSSRLYACQTLPVKMSKGIEKCSWLERKFELPLLLAPFTNFRFGALVKISTANTPFKPFRS